jgi:hypothetical protein
MRNLGGLMSLAAAAAALATGATAAAPISIIQKAETTFGPLASTSRYVVYSKPSEDDDGPVAVEELDLTTHRTVQLAAASVPSLGVAATAGWAIYAAPWGLGDELVAVRHGSTRKVVLSTTPISGITSRGDRVAWAEQRGSRERVIVRTMTSGRDWVAADLPRCVSNGCFRIDYVTLADHGVVFTRGAIGPQPSVVLRRRFNGPLEQTVVMNDPQPDLVPSYDGGYYYVLDRGWRRWRFAQRSPTPAPGPQPPQGEVLDVERAGLLVRTGDACHPTLALIGAHTRSFRPPTVAATTSGVCALVTGFSVDANRLVVGWELIPKLSLDTHSDAGMLGILAAHPVG